MPRHRYIVKTFPTASYGYSFSVTVGAMRFMCIMMNSNILSSVYCAAKQMHAKFLLTRFHQDRLFNHIVEINFSPCSHKTLSSNVSYILIDNEFINRNRDY